ncbi:hypothetical protein [Gracilimonas sediminicola]|uniref:hypothetical protein n=1 Tax=Gracilimonas sediminicola TaxID=2952158 RepID=UPI0038D3E6B4
MDSNYVGLAGCGGCGFSDSEVKDPENEKTIKDTVDEAQKYSNPEIPIWVKVAAGIATVFGLSKLTKTSKKKS